MPKSAEFILQPHLPSVVLVEPFGPNFSAIAHTLVQDPELQIVECISAMDTLSIVRQMSACVILGHAATVSEVNQHLTILKTLAGQVQQKRNVRMLVTVSSSLSAELVEKLTIYGCTEILPDSTPAKALLFKIERHLKALPKPTNAELDAAGVARPNLLEDNEAAPEIPAGVRLVPALEVPRDRWCLSGGGARCEPGGNGDWKVHLRGPSTKHGRWLPVSGKAEVWQWLTGTASAEEAEPKVTRAGADPREDAINGWFASSTQEPIYRHGFWTFGGRSPWLGYLENGKPVGHKFKVSEKGSLLIARDSEAALSWLALLRNKLARSGAVETQVALAPPNSGAGPADSQVVYVTPLLILSDFWVLEKYQPKRVAERWLVQLTGPGPSVGRWVAQSGNDQSKSGAQWAGSAEKWWRWVPDAGLQDPFTKELGSWFYFGLAPNYLDGSWSFASSSPELAFYFKGACYGAKFRQRGDGALEVARDSTAAFNMIPLIRQSHERQVPLRPKSASPIAVTIAPPDGPPVPSDDPRGYKETEDFTDVAAKPAPMLDFVDKAEPVATRPDYVEVKVAPPAGMDSIFAAETPGPTLSPLALAFLASELVARRKGSIRERCDRYCAYLLASFGGLRVEVWVPSPNADGSDSDIETATAWACVGTSDDKPAAFEELARKGSGLKSLKGMPVRVAEIRPALQNPIGLLVIGGRGAQMIEVQYAQAAARSAVGLVLGAKTELVADSGPELEVA